MPYLLVDNRNPDLINTHFRACQKDQTPYVLCKLHGSQAEVEFDSVTLGPEQTTVLDNRAAEIATGLAPIIVKHATARQRDLVSSHYISLRGLSIETAKALAADLFDFYSVQLNRT